MISPSQGFWPVQSGMAVDLGAMKACVKKVMFDYFQAQHKNSVLNK